MQILTNFSEENRALKKLQKIQAKEIQEVDQFISMTASRSKVARQDVRDTEMTSIDIDHNVRWDDRATEYGKRMNPESREWKKEYGRNICTKKRLILFHYALLFDVVTYQRNYNRR